MQADPLFSAVVLLASGVVGLTVARFARISPIVGFFVIGALIGPQALALIDNHSPTIHFLGELGVSFLLFDIGLHLSLKELRRGWRSFLFAGVMQFVVVSTVLSAVCLALGLPWLSSIMVAAIFSLSSTALVLKILSDDREENSPVGKRATEILVFQDITAILLLVILSGDLSQGVSLGLIAHILLKIAGAGLFVIVIGRLALKPLFRLLISLKSDEVITAFALLLVFLASWGTQSLGLSLALGAFLGGLALSESSYSYLVRGELAPFRSLLLSLFFLSVGINLNLASMYSNAWLLVTLLLIFSFAKVAGNFAAFRVSRIQGGVATLLSFLLAQGSEFAFVLLGLAVTAGLIDSSMFSLSVSVVGLSLATTPLFASMGCMLSRSTCSVRDEGEAGQNDPREVIIVRIDDFGRQLATLLDQERIPYRAHDQDMERLAYAKSRGLNVYFSDLNRPRTLGRVSLGKALAVISLVEDDQILDALAEGLNKINANVPFIAATESPIRLEKLLALGIEQSFIKNQASILALFESLLRALDYEEVRVEHALDRAMQLLEPEGMYPVIRPTPQLEAQTFAA